MAVGAPPLATPFTVDELTIVAWLKNVMRMRCALAIKTALISASRSVKDVYPFNETSGEFLCHDL